MMKNTFPELQPERLQTAVGLIKSRLERDDFPNNRELLEICGDNGIQPVNNAGGPHLIHEILETALNLYLADADWLSAADSTNKDEILVRLEDITGKLPTQSWRDQEQVKFQQFSTPPALAFILADLLCPEIGATALEPSAGTGSLAVWLKKRGCSTVVNEISGRRRRLLELQNYQPLNFNAEFLDDLLPTEIRPNYILMNPPFSAGSRQTNDSNYGFRHVETALRRLNPGGRLVALLGAKTSLNTKKGKKFWHQLGKEYLIHAFLVVPPQTFYKYGTTFQTVAVVISKPEAFPHPLPPRPQIYEFQSLGEMMRLTDSLTFTDF